MARGLSLPALRPERTVLDSSVVTYTAEQLQGFGRSTSVLPPSGETDGAIVQNWWRLPANEWLYAMSAVYLEKAL